MLAGDLDAKRLELLTQISPKAKRIAMIWNPAQQRIDEIIRNVDAAAARLHVTLLRYPARDRTELSATLAGFPAPGPTRCWSWRIRCSVSSARRSWPSRAQRLPGVYFWREFAELGGLASYGTNLASVYRRAATYVDRILKGAKPGELPVEQPTTFDLVVNRSAARELGITLPPVVLQRADTGTAVIARRASCRGRCRCMRRKDEAARLHRGRRPLAKMADLDPKRLSHRRD